MNKREAKIRGLKIIYHHLYAMETDGTLENSVDDDTFDFEMEQIGDEMRYFIYQLEQRISKLERRRTPFAPDKSGLAPTQVEYNKSVLSAPGSEPF